MFHRHLDFIKSLLALIIVALLLSSCGHKKKDASKMQGQGAPKFVAAEGFVVQQRPFREDYVASGSLMPNEEIEVHPEVSGRVVRIAFREGSRVRKGELLVELSGDDIQAQIRKLQAQRQLQVKLRDRQKGLVSIGGISRQDFESTQTEISSIDADIAYSEAQLRKTKILAPFDGIVGIRGISVGAIVSPATAVAALQQVFLLKLDFDIPDQYRTLMTPGKVVHFTVDGRIDTLLGNVTAIDPGASSMTRTIRVRAMVPNAGGQLTAGSFAHVLLAFETQPDAILIPSQSVIPGTRDKKVAVVRGGKASMTVIRSGARTESKVQVLQGLRAGDTILTTGIMQVKDSMPVKITRVRG